MPTTYKLKSLESQAKYGLEYQSSNSKQDLHYYNKGDSAALQLTHIYFSANDEPNMIKWADFAATNYQNTKALMIIANYFKIEKQDDKMLYYLKWAVDLEWHGACKQMALYYKVSDDKMNMIQYANLGTSYGCVDCAKMMVEYYENMNCHYEAAKYHRAIETIKRKY